MRYNTLVRRALLGNLLPASVDAVAPTVTEWTERAAALTAFVHRRLPRTMPPVTVFVTPVEERQRP